MKKPSMLGSVERKAVRQMNLLLRGARKQYDRLTHSAAKVSDVTRQRRYIRSVETTIGGAEKIIAQLKKRITSAKKLLPGAGKRKTGLARKSRVKKAKSRKASSRKTSARKTSARKTRR